MTADDRRTHVALPSASSPRWILPARPARAFAASLLVYVPVTPRGVLGWHAARLFALLGGARVLPRVHLPAEDVERTADLVDDDHHLALSYGYHGSHAVQLVVGRDGSVRYFVKVAKDARAAYRLGDEAAMTVALATLLPPPLRVPRVLEPPAGRVVLEAVDWRPRWRPWVLPPELARGLGTFFRTGARIEDGVLVGPAHGDAAPWNVVRDRAGDWWLLDWADARDTAPLGTDLWHWLVQAHALVGRPSQRQLLAGLEGRGWVGEAIAAYAEGAEVDLGELRDTFEPHVRTSLAGMVGSAEDVERGRAARAALLDVLHP